jgi:hypothetical protein
MDIDRGHLKARLGERFTHLSQLFRGPGVLDAGPHFESDLVAPILIAELNNRTLITGLK